MATINVGGQELALDEDGYLTDWSVWTKEAADIFAQKDGIELTDEHWEIINFLRQYFEEYQIAPAIRVLVKEVKAKFGAEKGNLKYVYRLFPAGPAKQACKYAGLPKPTGCV
ncbi:TusE/DsrC/DsvC family sulfur relay protein [archaeon]|nr:TusE/DsrC/DsvC family sulfur relay protein [archaeon]